MEDAEKITHSPFMYYNNGNQADYYVFSDRSILIDEGSESIVWEDEETLAEENSHVLDDLNGQIECTFNNLKDYLL